VREGGRGKGSCVVLGGGKMPLFMSDAELEREGGDVSVVVSRAEVYIRELQQQVETHKARADAAAINAEQTCALIEQKFLALTAQFSLLENEKEQTVATMERRSTELAQVQAQMHKLEIEAVCVAASPSLTTLLSRHAFRTQK